MQLRFLSIGRCRKDDIRGRTRVTVDECLGGVKLESDVSFCISCAGKEASCIRPRYDTLIEII